MSELDALQNAVNSIGNPHFYVLEAFCNDKRKTVKTYFLQFKNITLSPKLDYENMNHFILGVKKGFELQKFISS
jgi:hypothetical protein